MICVVSLFMSSLHVRLIKIQYLEFMQSTISKTLADTGGASLKYKCDVIYF